MKTNWLVRINHTALLRKRSNSRAPISIAYQSVAFYGRTLTQELSGLDGNEDEETKWVTDIIGVAA